MIPKDPNNPISIMPVNEPGHGPAAQSAQEDLAKQQQQYAKDFRGNIGGMAQSAFNPIEQQAKVNLAQQMRQQRHEYSRRGLLDSDVFRGAQSRLQGDTASALEQKRAGINQSFGGAADQFDTQALKAGLDIQAGQQAIQDILYQRAMAKYQAEQQQTGQIIGAAPVLGAALL